MFRVPPENFEQAAKILEIVVHESCGRPPNTESVKQLAEAIHKMWELHGLDDPWEGGPKSAALRRTKSKAGIIDHPIPQIHLAKKLLTMHKEDYRLPYVSNLLHQFAFFCFISQEEKKRLAQAGIADKMPTSWNGIDRYARYAEVGISMGEEKMFNGEELRELLSDPPEPFYVYRLRTPTGKVFYIGKGVKLRVLSHEKEIYKSYFRTHTNWKKLNKIAQIINAGKAVGYEIESWHIDETQASLRENELIIIAERENPWTLCNSDGHRWAGKPNRQLCELRRGRGLET
jgi:hypothetical protein